MAHKKLSKKLTIVLFAVSMELVIVFFSVLYNDGRADDVILYFVGMHFTVVDFILSCLLYIRFTRNRPFGNLGNTLAVVGSLMLIAISWGAWGGVIFPRMLESAEREYGVSAQATVTSYDLVNIQRRGGGTYSAGSLDSARALKIDLVYDGHFTTRLVHKGDQGFDELYAAGLNNQTVSVRYIRPLPSIVRTNAELGL